MTQINEKYDTIAKKIMEFSIDNDNCLENLSLCEDLVRIHLVYGFNRDKFKELGKDQTINSLDDSDTIQIHDGEKLHFFIAFHDVCPMGQLMLMSYMTSMIEKHIERNSMFGCMPFYETERIKLAKLILDK